MGTHGTLWFTNTGEIRTRRRGFWLAVVLVVTCSTLMLRAAAADASPSCGLGTTLNIVGHPDDDLLFQSPDLLHDVQSGKCVRTVYITAGERDRDIYSLQWREEGAEAAYAQMAGAANSWTTTDAGVRGHPMRLVTLIGHPEVSLVFMRLPEGFWGDGGTPQDETLQNLWLGTISQIHAEDGSSAYTRPELISTLGALMRSMQPNTIRTQDYVGPFDDGDHDDHHATAYFVRAAHLGYATPHTLIGYMGMGTEGNPQNVFDANLGAKTSAFYAYLAHDSAPCGAPADCGTNEYSQWLARQYTIGQATNLSGQRGLGHRSNAPHGH